VIYCDEEESAESDTTDEVKQNVKKILHM